MPPLPDVSMPCTINRTDRWPPLRPSANSRSWTSDSPFPPLASAALPLPTQRAGRGPAPAPPGEQPLLDVGQPLPAPGQRRPALGLAALEPGRGPRLDVRQREARPDTEPVGQDPGRVHVRPAPRR